MKPAFLAALAICCAGPAAAHPHVWIDARVELQVADGAIRGIRHEWRFDDVFSDFLIGEFDADGDLAFSADETARIREEAFALLQEYDYFTDLRQGGVRLPTKTATGLSVEVDPAKHLVTYRFETPPPQPVKLDGAAISLALYDETFYVDIGMAEADPVHITGTAGCSYDIREDLDIDLLGGLFHPQAIWPTCAGS